MGFGCSALARCMKGVHMMKPKPLTKAASLAASAILAFGTLPAAALAQPGTDDSTRPELQLSVGALATQEAEKASYGLAVSASFTGAQEVTLVGYAGGRAGRMTVDAMSNPKATIMDGAGNKIADAVALDGEGKVAVSSAVAVGVYTAIVSSDNFADVMVSFAYPAARSLSIGGAEYWFFTRTDDALALVANNAKTDDALIAAGWSNIAGTDVWYQAAPGSAALSGTLYGMDTTQATSYTDLYSHMMVGASPSTADYDTVSSATGIAANKHYGQLSTLVARDIKHDSTALANATDEKRLENVLTGAYCTTKTVSDVKSYVEASVLKAAGKSLTEAQSALLSGIRLNGNATVDPATVTDRVAVDTVTSSGFFTGWSYFDPTTTGTNKCYGQTKFVIRPTAGANTAGGAPFSWTDYYQSLYAGTISNGEVTIGMAPWIDFYAEAGHSAVEMSIANGLNPYNGTNKADVKRFASMYDQATGRLKPGAYTITLYAAGYNPLSYTFELGAAVPSSDWKTIGLENMAVEEGSTATVASYAPNPEENGAAAVEVKTYAEKAAVIDNAVALAEPLAEGSYVVMLNSATHATGSNPDGTYCTLTFDANKTDSTASLASKTTAYTGKNISINAATVTGSTGKVFYEYFLDKACTKKASSHKNAGIYYVRATVEADAAHNATTSNVAKLKITKAANTLKVAPVKKVQTVKYGKKTTLAAAKTFKVAKNVSAGKVVYSKTSGNAKIKVAKNGSVTVNKGLKKGSTYTVKVKATSAATKNYKAAVVKNITFKVKVG